MEVYVNIGLSFWDFLISVILLWAIYRGYRKGVIVHSVTLLVLLVGTAFSAKIGYGIFYTVQDRARVPLYNMPIVIFAILFVIAVFVSHFVGGKVMKNLGKPQLGFTNRMLGVGVNLIKYLFMISVCLILIFKLDSNYEFISKEEKARTKLFFPVMNIAPSVFRILRFPEVNPVPYDKPSYMEEMQDDEFNLDDI